MRKWLRNIILLFLVSFSLNDFTFSQQKDVKSDSTLLYKNIESLSKRSGFSRFIYRLIFKQSSTDSVKKAVKKKGYKKLIQKPYSAFEGKFIRNIDIVTLDPFGYSATDTAVAKQNFFYKAGNNIHISTQTMAIRNLLVFRKNQPFNTLRVKESERLIRSQKYVHEVFFRVVPAGLKSDSVDILIRELDAWSIIPQGSVSNSRLKFSLTDKNIVGSGHELQSAFARNFTTGISTINTNYFIPNIKNTYISSTLHYMVDGYKNFNKSLSVDRPFFSPLAKWAAGVSFTSQLRNDSIADQNLVYVPVILKFKTQDYWAGTAIRIFKASAGDERITNLIFSSRYLRVRYYDKPSEQIDPLHMFSGEDFYMASVGISSRKYVQDKYLFKYGVIEDVPVGSVFSVTGGYQVRNNSGRPYLGTRFSIGTYNNWGYISTNVEFGTFLQESHIEQGVLAGGINYFTGLFEIGKWKFRQFVKPQFIIGINRFSYDSLNLNDGFGLEGFHSTLLSGTRRLLLTLQTQSYSPWRFIGFRFGPYLSCSFGMLGDDNGGFKNSRVYSQIGFGVLIKNENLVFNSFQFSVSFYPLIPGRGNNIFLLNSFRTNDFGLRDFEIGKPETRLYH